MRKVMEFYLCSSPQKTTVTLIRSVSDSKTTQYTQSGGTENIGEVLSFVFVPFVFVPFVWPRLPPCILIYLTACHLFIIKLTEVECASVFTNGNRYWRYIMMLKHLV